MSFCFTFSFAMRAIAQIGAISLACHVVRYVFKQILGLAVACNRCIMRQS